MICAAALLAIASAIAQPRVHIQVLRPPDARSDAPLARSKRIELRFIVALPAGSDRGEMPEVVALNQQKGYFDQRPPANMTVAMSRLDGAGKRTPVLIRLNTMGSGGDTKEISRDIAIDVLENADVRRKRIRDFFMANAAPPSDDRERQADAFVKYLDPIYVDNPPGDYEVSIAYEPATGAFAGQHASASVHLTVAPGPDMIELLRANAKKK